jgi:hypothetical protein
MIVDFIQRGEVLKIMAENESILASLKVIGGQTIINGYWFYLVSRLGSLEDYS